MADLDPKLEEAVVAAKAAWGDKTKFAGVDAGAYDPARDGDQAGPRAVPKLVAVPPQKGAPDEGSKLGMASSSARIPTGPEADARFGEVAGRMPAIMAESLGLSEKEAMEKTRQFVALHELGHCKDHLAIKAGLDASILAGAKGFDKWSAENPELAKAIPEPVAKAVSEGGSVQEVRDALDSDRTKARMEATADIFAVEAGAKAGLWDRQKMYSALGQWRAPADSTDPVHDTTRALKIAAASPSPDAHEAADAEARALAAMPAHQGEIGWNRDGSPSGITKEKLLDYSRREALTGLERGEAAPSVQGNKMEASSADPVGLSAPEAAVPKLSGLSSKLSQMRAEPEPEMKVEAKGPSL